jgi:hypothetical protein
MTPHLQLLWNAVFAPAAAVDLAKQHPSPYRLGWIYVGILTAAIFVCELIAKYVLKPIFQTLIEPARSGTDWADTILGNVLFSALCYSVMYVFQRWFWRKFADASGSRESIDACLVAGFAFSALILLPEYVLMEAIGSYGVFLPLAGLFLFVAIGVVYYTLYFSHGLGISKTKSFWLNVLVAIIYIVLLFVAAIAVSVFFAALTGTSMFFTFGPPEGNVSV